MEKKRLLVSMRDEIRYRYDTLRTEQTYIQWVRSFILFHKKRHPVEMGKMKYHFFLLTLLSKEKWLHLHKTRHSLPCCFSTSMYSS